MATDAKENKTGAQLPFYIHDQYVKDLSFENPNFLVKYSENQKQPQVSVNVETAVAKLADNNYEISLKIMAKSQIDNNDIFVLDLTYAALVSVAPDLKNDILETILLVHCPFLMFPFAREVVANTTKAGGYPPLMVEPIDFASLYLQKKKETSNDAEQKEDEK